MRHISLVSLAVLMLAACASYDDPMTSSTVLPGTGYNDPEVAGILTAANEGEVQVGNVALSRASTSAVRNFAQMMVTDHTNTLNEARALFGSRGITPAEANAVRDLRNGTQQTIAALNTYSGAEFDRVYMQTMIDKHQWMLNAIDRGLLPSTRSPEFRNFITSKRATVVHHLDRARQIMASLP